MQCTYIHVIAPSFRLERSIFAYYTVPTIISSILVYFLVLSHDVQSSVQGLDWCDFVDVVVFEGWPRSQIKHANAVAPPRIQYDATDLLIEALYLDLYGDHYVLSIIQQPPFTGRLHQRMSMT